MEIPSRIPREITVPAESEPSEKDGIFWMKRAAKWEVALLIGLMVSLAWGCWADRTQRELADQVLRLHVLANSDSEADQALKLKVRDSVLQKAEEILDGCPDRETAEARLSAALPEIEGAARQRIAAEGADEAVTAELRPTVFPTKEYEDFTLPAGEYLALRVVIGEGEGHNWWCVMYPNLCFSNSLYRHNDKEWKRLQKTLTPREYRKILESGNYTIRFKFLEYLKKKR